MRGGVGILGGWGIMYTSNPYCGLRSDVRLC